MTRFFPLNRSFRTRTARAALWVVLASTPLCGLADTDAKQLIWNALSSIGKSEAQSAIGIGGADAIAAGGVPAPAGATAPGCPRVKRSASLGAVGSRPEGYEPAALWPENGTCEIMSISDLKFPAAEAQKSKFRDASKLRCSDCEGGYRFDAGWNKIPLEKLMALQPGESLNWKGSRYQGTIALTGQHPIGNFPCRQYHWTLKDAGRVIAEREGLHCQYKGPYNTAPTWSEIL